MGEVKVSVVMGTAHPKEEWLRNAVQSIIDQTWKDWELLLYHDGLEDGCEPLIQQIVKMDPRIHYLPGEKNRGLAHALNACTAQAHGEYIARMDDDDFSEPERLESQLLFLEEHPDIDWVGCEALLFDEHGIWGKANRPEQPTQADYFKYSPFVHPSVMFRKKVLIDAGGYSESKIVARCEDYELFMRLTAQGGKGRNLLTPLFRYREDSAKMYQRRFRYYWYEMIVRIKGFAQMDCLNIRSIPYICKPLVVWLLSHFSVFAQQLRRNRITDNHGFAKTK